MELKQTADVAARHRSILFSRPQNQIGFGSTSASACLFLLRSAQLRWINRNLHEYHFSRPLSARTTAEHRAATSNWVRASSRPTSYTCLIHCFQHASKHCLFTTFFVVSVLQKNEQKLIRHFTLLTHFKTPTSFIIGRLNLT